MEKLKAMTAKEKQDQIPSFKAKMSTSSSFEHQYWGISIEADLDFLCLGILLKIWNEFDPHHITFTKRSQFTNNFYVVNNGAMYISSFPLAT
jgi:hypothetical protein